MMNDTYARPLHPQMENVYYDQCDPSSVVTPPGRPLPARPAISTTAAGNDTAMSADYDLSMSNAHRTVLLRCRLKIIEDLDVSDVMAFMIQEGILNLSMRDEIMAPDTRENKVKKFLDILPRRGASAFPVFVKALEKDYHFIAETLCACAKSVEELPYQEELHRRGCDIVRTAKVPKNEKENDYEWVLGDDCFDYLCPSGLSGYETVPGLGTRRKGANGEKSETDSELITAVVLQNCLATKITADTARSHNSAQGTTAGFNGASVTSSNRENASSILEVSTMLKPPHDVHHNEESGSHLLAEANSVDDHSRAENTFKPATEATDGHDPTHAELFSLLRDDGANKAEDIDANHRSCLPEKNIETKKTSDGLDLDPALYLIQTLCSASVRLKRFIWQREPLCSASENTMTVSPNVSSHGEGPETTATKVSHCETSDGAAQDIHTAAGEESLGPPGGSDSTEIKQRIGCDNSARDFITDVATRGPVVTLPTPEPPCVSSSLLTNAGDVFDDRRELPRVEAAETAPTNETGVCSAAEVTDVTTHESGCHDASDDASDSDDGDDDVVKLSRGDVVFMYADHCRADKQTIVYDIYGRCLVISRKYIGISGDPTTKAWYYPLRISSVQATLLLSSINIPGCFLVYIPPNLNANQEYNLSVCSEGGKVSHYHIYRDSLGELSLRCSDVNFPTIINLVDYYQGNRDVLCCRLRCPPSEKKKKMKYGGEYDKNKWHIDYNQLKMASDSGSTSGLLGEGRFSQVIRAEYKNTPVAVKVPDPTQHDGPWFLSDFFEEAKLLSALKHPNMLKVIGFCMHPNPFLVTEVMPLGDLKEFLRKRRKRQEEPTDYEEGSLQVSFEMCCQLASALKYLKSRTYIIHRDIAARNVLLGENNRIKLCDFGMARWVVDDKYKADACERVAVRWAAPEVMTSLMYSTASDIWAAGVVFWEIFADGAIPYGDYSNIEVTKLVVGTTKLRRPAKCPADLYQTLLSCWHFDPKMRPTPDALSEMLQHKSYYKFIDHPPVEADAISFSSYESLDTGVAVVVNNGRSASKSKKRKQKKKNILTRLFTSSSDKHKASK